MYLKAQETAQLYNSLSVKLGTDTTDVLFKYIDNKTERSVEASIITLATKEDIESIHKEISQLKVYSIKWMLIFWIGQVASALAIASLFLNK